MTVMKSIPKVRFFFLKSVNGKDALAGSAMLTPRGEVSRSRKRGGGVGGDHTMFL